MTTWTLTEWEWAQLPLSAADVLVAQAHLGSALAVESCVGGFRLRALGVAGVVVLIGFFSDRLFLAGSRWLLRWRELPGS